MAQTDYALTALLNRLGANNIGAISDSDVRSIVEYARPHVIQIARENFATASLPTPYTASDIVAYRLLNTPTSSESSGYLSAVAGPPEAVEYDSGTHPDRLFRVEWDFWGYPAAEISGQLALYKQNDGDSWPTATRLRSSRINTLEAGEVTSSPVFRIGTKGSLLVQLSPGDRVVPLLEVNANTFGGASALSYNFTVTSVGPVEDALTAIGTGDSDVAFESTFAGSWVPRDTTIPS